MLCWETHPSLKCLAGIHTHTRGREKITREAHIAKRRKTMPRKWNYICAINTGTHFFSEYLLVWLQMIRLLSAFAFSICLVWFARTWPITSKSAQLFLGRSTNTKLGHIDMNEAHAHFAALNNKEEVEQTKKKRKPTGGRKQVVMWKIEIDSKNHVCHFWYYLWARCSLFFRRSFFFFLFYSFDFAKWIDIIIVMDMQAVGLH